MCYVTIYYPDGEQNFLNYRSEKRKRVNSAIETQNIGDSLKCDYVNDRAYKIQFQKWVNQLWLDKDKKMLQLEEQANKDN